MALKEERFGALCAQAGLYYTRGVHAALTALSEAPAPLTTDDIHRFARRCRLPMNLATAYRVLKNLADAGIIARHRLGDGKARYSFQGAGDEGHLVDLADGAVTAFSDDTLGQALAGIAESLGYRLVRYRLVLYGDAGEPGSPGG